MQAVNLLPAYARPGHRWASVGKDLSARRALTVGGIAAGALAIALGGLYAYERSVVSDKRSELATTQARLTAVNAQAAPFRATEALVTARLASATTVVQNRIPWENVLGGLSRVLPSQVYLTSLQAMTPMPAASLAAGPTAATTAAAAPVAAPVPGAPATGFSVQGNASSQVRVALVLDRLALMPWLSNITLVSISKAATTPGSSNGGGDQFSVDATFNQAPGGGK
jgi:Tfp pilus assembly protein PilN